MKKCLPQIKLSYTRAVNYPLARRSAVANDGKRSKKYGNRFIFIIIVAMQPTLAPHLYLLIMVKILVYVVMEWNALTALHALLMTVKITTHMVIEYKLYYRLLWTNTLYVVIALRGMDMGQAMW